LRKSKLSTRANTIATNNEKHVPTIKKLLRRRVSAE
jgi:hypothetical protein